MIFMVPDVQSSSHGAKVTRGGGGCESAEGER